mmetsp:Transcript_27204/g.62751  ORF Transcript_27204/g.62751 Transcript_27204/m.62751 type:complete len:96 (-) Transcript_27204:47-334(-)
MDPDAIAEAKSAPPAGFLADGLVHGSLVYLVLGLVGTFLALNVFAKQTPNITKGESGKLGVVLVWTATFCMWLLWACVYMHQMVPLIRPIRPPEA